MPLRDYTQTDQRRQKYTKPFGPKQIAVIEIIDGSWIYMLWDHDRCILGEKNFDWDLDQTIAEADEAIREIADAAKRRADAFWNTAEI